MDDIAKLEQILKAGCPCISIVTQEKEYDLVALAKATQGYSGAEIEQAVISGLRNAFSQNAEPDTDLFLEVLENSVPLSVTMAEKRQALRHWAQTRCVPAD